jgi:alanine racemase
MSSVARIDLNTLRGNLALVRQHVGTAPEILACVKAKAYGHGMLRCAHALIDAGVNALGIARLDEAEKLRTNGITSRLVLLGPESLEHTEALVNLDVEILIDSVERLHSIQATATRTGKRPSVHLAIDSGMGRFGANMESARGLAEMLSSDSDIHWAGVMTHFAVADSDAAFSMEQWARFESETDAWAKSGIAVPTRHTANSAAILRLPQTHADMVRPGLMLYGMQPSPNDPEPQLRPVLSWTTNIAALHRHSPGDTIGYGRTHTVHTDSLIATLPVGYGDGVPWSRNNAGWVLVKGVKVPVVGRVSMDQTTVDVTGIQGVELSDEVALIGRQGTEYITTEQWAEWSGTINYEITTRLASRVHREYVG